MTDNRNWEHLTGEQLPPVNYTPPPPRPRKRGRWLRRLLITGAAVIGGVATVIVAAALAFGSGSPATTSHANTDPRPAPSGLNTYAPPSEQPSAPAAAEPTVAQQQALESAESYLDMGGFSKAGLIEQLHSSAGEGFTLADARWAVRHVHANWNHQAVLSAQGYLDMGGFSRASLIEQLHSPTGEGFTLAQATYAADHVGLTAAPAAQAAQASATQGSVYGEGLRDVSTNPGAWHLWASPNTSTAFAINVYQAWDGVPGVKQVYSPATGQSYAMTYIADPDGTVSASGGNGAFVKF